MKTTENVGAVYLVGAGPGDPGLITAKGMARLNRCDTVVYDSLSSDQLLELAPEKAERILPLLTEEEAAVFRRGRNAHVKSVPGHATRAQYGEATALEALLGWLYLQGRRERINQLFCVMMEE